LKYWSERNFKEIGKGGFGVVWKGYNKHTHEEVKTIYLSLTALDHTSQKVALKFYVIDQQQQQCDDREYQILQECACLCIAPKCLQHGTLCVPSECRRDSFCHIETLVMEFQIKTLAHQFEEFENLCVLAVFRLQRAMFAAQEAIELLFRLHSKGIIHRDIKPENLMYNVRFSCLLIFLVLSIFLFEEDCDYF
jgi:serine/threonine protein kinase